VNQTVPPLRWVIINDGSTDNTRKIIEQYARKYEWIEPIILPESRERHFGRKAVAFNIGYERIKNLDFDLIGNLDADISFDKDYFAFLISRFVANPRLGVAGTLLEKVRDSMIIVFQNRACLRRLPAFPPGRALRKSADSIPRKEGGVDLAAVLTARMRGWVTETFTEKYCVHNRPMGKAGPNLRQVHF